MTAILIRDFTGPWRSVTADEAREHVRFFRKHSLTRQGPELDRYIEREHLRGITVARLMEGCE